MLEPNVLDQLAEQVEDCEAVRRSSLQCGDWVLVTTRNSTYSIYVLEGDRYLVCGGWFDRAGLAPVATTINGCTFGGRAIATDIIAAPGLFLEFGNDVLTTRIQQVRVIRAGDPTVFS